MHACGHDVHVACLAGAAQMLAEGRGHWAGTVVALFQPAEEAGDGARAMIGDGLAELIPRPDVALAQHVMPLPAGQVCTRSGPTLSAADSMQITVHGRGAHGSMPQAAVDPVVLAAMIVVRLQTVVSREVAPGETAVLTVGSVHAGTKSNVIPDRAVLQLNVRTYSDATRTAVLDAVQRIVRAECEASGSPQEPEFELSTDFCSPTTIQPSPHGSKPRSRRSSATGPGRPGSSLPARTSATSQPRWVSPTRTG
jgi:amidohydrolase